MQLYVVSSVGHTAKDISKMKIKPNLNYLLPTLCQPWNLEAPSALLAARVRGPVPKKVRTGISRRTSRKRNALGHEHFDES